MAQNNRPADNNHSVEDGDPPTSRARLQKWGGRPLEPAGLTREGVSPSDEDPASQVAAPVLYPLAGQSL